MKKIDRKALYILIITISALLIYFFFIKEDDYIKDNFDLEENDIYTESKNTTNNLENIESERKIIIYIAGAVRNEGIYEVEENSRIADVIEKAEGLLETADIKDINLAYIVEDGMKIYIPTENEKVNEMQDNTKEYVTKEESNLKESDQASKTIISSNNSKININTATQTELETLPGIGPSTALNIIDYRKKNGGFTSVEDIKNVSGIGDAKFIKIKDFIKI